MTTAARTDERVRYLDSDGEQLLAVVTPATAADARGGALLSWGAGGTVSAIGRNRMLVTMAERLADRGYTSLRLDFHGVGESTGASEALRLDRPYVADALAGIDALRAEGAQRLLLLGTCFGARTVLASAAHVRDLDGVVLFPPPVREFGQGQQYGSRPVSWFVRRALTREGVLGLFDAERRRRYVRIVQKKVRYLRDRENRAPAPGAVTGRRTAWVSDTFLAQLTDLVDRGVPTLIVYGSDDGFYHEFTEGLDGPLGALLDRAGDLVEVVVLDGHKVHGAHRLETQDLVMESLERWLTARVLGPDREPEVA